MFIRIKAVFERSNNALIEPESEYMLLSLQGSPVLEVSPPGKGKVLKLHVGDRCSEEVVQAVADLCMDTKFVAVRD